MLNSPIAKITSLLLLLTTTVACSPQSQNDRPDTPTLTQVAVPQPPLEETREQTIVLGDVSDNPRNKIRKFQPLANYLSGNLSQYNYGHIKIAPDLETMITWLKSGEVDLYIDSPYPAMLAVNQAGAVPILRRWKKDSAEYHSIIFTIGDRQINSLADLTGKIVALDHPASTTGYMLPLGELLDAGLETQEVKSASSPVNRDLVGYVFSHEDKNSIEWLLSGKVAAAAIDNYSYNKLPAKIKAKTVILAESEQIARNLVLVRPNMSPEDVEDITATLLNMEQTAAGKSVLQQFSKTTKFDQLTLTENLTKMQDLYQQVQK